MKYEIVYKSATGNTKRLAEEIMRVWGKENCVYFGEPAGSSQNTERAAVGFWTDKGTCSDDLQDYLKQLHHKQIVLFGTAGFGGSPDYFDRILKNVKEMIPKDNAVIAAFMCQGKMPQGIRDRYQKALDEDPDNHKMIELIANFDRASTHPDDLDIENLRQLLQKLKS